MRDAIFEFRNRLREIAYLDHDSVAPRPCEVQNCGRTTNVHWQLRMNSNGIDDVYVCEGHGDPNKMLQVHHIEDRYVIREKQHSSH